MVIRFLLIVFLFAQSQFTKSQDCNVSAPNLDDPRGAIRSGELYGWFGSEELAALIPQNGQWISMGKQHNYRNKFWWWHNGYNADSRSEEFLILEVKNIETGESYTVDNATNARTGSDDYEWNSMLIGLEFPSSGCWKITGKHNDQELDIIVRVEG